MRVIQYLGVALLCVWSRLAGAEPLVEVPAGPAYELVNGGTSKVVIPLKLLKGASVTSGATVAVTAGEARQPRWVAAFPASFETGAAQIVITPNFAEVRLPLTYSISVQLKGKAPPPKPAGTEPAAEGTPPVDADQVIEVPLVLKPAKLAAIAPLAVAREQWHPFPEADSPPIELRLHETSEVTTIADLHIEQITPATNGDQPTAARLEAPPSELKLGSGGRRTVQLKARDFGVGTTKGSLTLSAHQLSEPVLVPYEVKVKVSDWIILPWFLVFGLLGWLIRHLLQNAGVLAELRVELERLSKDIDEEAATSPFADDITELQRLEQEARKALESSAHATLREQLQTLKTKLRAAQTKKIERTRELWEKVNDYDRLLKTTFDLPNGLELVAVRSELSAAMQALQAFRPNEAEQRLTALRKAVGQLAKEVQTWSESVVSSLDGLQRGVKKEGFVLPAAFQIEAEPLVESVRAKLAQTGYDEIKPPAPSEWLAAAHEANGAVRQLAKRVLRDLRVELEEVVRALSSSNHPDRENFVTILSGLPTLNGDVLPAQLEALVAALRGIYDELKKLLEKAEPLQLLDEGRFAAAVSKELTQLGSLSPMHKVADTLAKAPAPMAELAAAAVAAAVAARPAAPASGAILIMPQRSREERALVQLQTLNAARGVVSGALMAVVVWVLYRDSWVGTPGDFVGVAAFAFFTDFTLQSVLEAASNVKKISLA